jgi:hypothetical protein
MVQIHSPRPFSLLVSPHREPLVSTTSPCPASRPHTKILPVPAERFRVASQTDVRPS